jgi:iron(III) transport system ATP-binding protein
MSGEPFRRSLAPVYRHKEQRKDGDRATLSARGLTKSFGPTEVLRGLDLEVPAGSLTAVLGPSGCGKTTLLRLLAGFDRPDAGTVRLDERELAGPGGFVPAERRRIGLVPQEGALFPHLSVAANIGFGLPRRQRAARVAELLELLDLGGLGKRHPHQLSGGQQQRVALARALAPTPAVILLDEPFDALDAGLRAQVRAEVRDALRETGTTGLIVTHDQEEALSLADLVAVMRDGAIAQLAPPRVLYREPVDAEVAQFVGEAALLDATLASGADHPDVDAPPSRGPVDRDGPLAVTVLGLLRLQSPPPAARFLAMLRPEQIVLGSPLLAPEGTPRGTVRALTFHGHDALAEVVVTDSATTILARTGGHLAPAVGDTVALHVEGTVLPLAGGPG